MDTLPTAGFFEGWNIGAISVKRVRLRSDGTAETDVRRHGGEPDKTVRQMLSTSTGCVPDGVAVTGPQASAIFTLPYLPESVCVEKAIAYLQVSPNLVLSLGGETFLAYCVAGGTVRNMLSTNRCAAGSGEFLVQQFGRMDLDLEAGIRLAAQGQRIKLASRCSVHCKSDATHKLNKGECTTADIAFSLIADLAARIGSLVQSANWPSDQIVLSGGLTRNTLLVEELRRLVPDSRIVLLPESVYLEALGAAVAAKQAGAREVAQPDTWIRKTIAPRFTTRPPLGDFADRVKRMPATGFARLQPGAELVLSVDAGSTTTKAVLLERKGMQPVAGCYLRTHGNPVRATTECLSELRKQLEAAAGGQSCRIIQAAVTGSGRELVSVYLDNCLSFNEILAHARAAREAAPGADTLFELGGQDAKFVALQSGIPVDYSMNDGCSAGTGSFLEEAAAHDMQVPIEEIGPLALEGKEPVAFGERCAAFINSDLRGALQQGARRSDVLAGLVYAITDNYLSRVVGARHIGRTVLLQGGVALNPALAPAVAGRLGMDVVVAPHPELMGCVGAAQMAIDLLDAGLVATRDYNLGSFDKVKMLVQGTFPCKTCDNQCEIQRIALNDRVYPFGGLCAKWEMQRRPKSLRYAEGKDLVSLRHELMFKIFAAKPPAAPHGRIGLPLALSTYELFPLYSRLLAELGYEVVLSRPGHGNRRTYATICYPGEIVHAAVDDLITRQLDYVFVPYLREFPIPQCHAHSYLCPVTQDIPGMIKASFESVEQKILSPEIGLSDHLRAATDREIVRMARQLGVGEHQARRALRMALEQQTKFETAYRDAIQSELHEVKGAAVVLVGRPYAAFAPEVNLSVPRKIASRGFTVIPADGLPFEPPPNDHEVWHFTQQTAAAIEFVKRRAETYICALSCFSCGPDAITHHRLRYELEGSPFCFLEIDSHTAHAGIETRIGAFLDIVEERRRQAGMGRAAVRRRPGRAHVERKGGRLWVVDTAGRRLALDDPRIKHVLLSDLPQITGQMIANSYSALGWKVSTTPHTSFETLQKARTVCSGRECLPFLAQIGKVVAHLRSRPPGEVTVFHLLDQEGPCQVGNWYDAFKIILERLDHDDAVAVYPTILNNYLGTGDRGALLKTAAVIAGDLMGEVRSSLRCLASVPEQALATLDELERGLLAAARHGVPGMEKELRRIARRLRAIPLSRGPETAPKVLLFGGINRIFVDKPIREFFEQQGILTKTNDVSEFITLLEFEWLIRSGMDHGRLRPEEYYPLHAIFQDLVKGPDRFTPRRALRAAVHCRVVDFLARRWRRIMSRSGLLFAPQTPFHELPRGSHDIVSWNGLTEAPCTLGRYFTCVRDNAFDGYINVGSFSCAPANTTTAVIGALSSRSKAPYAAIEADGTTITPSQVRQLETVAAQCRGRHAARLASR